MVEESLLLILYVKFQTVLVLKEHSLFTLQKLKKLKLYVKVKLDVLNYTTYVTYVVKLLVLKKYDNKKKLKSPITSVTGLSFFIFNTILMPCLNKIHKILFLRDHDFLLTPYKRKKRTNYIFL